MAQPQKQRQQQAADPYADLGQATLDGAPSDGKATYLKLPKGLEYFKPETGRNYRIVIMAWPVTGNHSGRVPGQLAPVKRYKVHGNIGPNNDKFCCPLMMAGTACPVCERFQYLSDRRKELNLDWAKDLNPLKAKDRDLYLIHDVDGRPNNLQVWDESYHLFGKALAEMIARKDAFKMYAHPDQGAVIEICGKQKSMGAGGGSCTDFTGLIISPFGPNRAGAPPKSLYERARQEAFSLDHMPVIASYDKIAKLFQGGVPAAKPAEPGSNRITQEQWEGTGNSDDEYGSVTEETSQQEDVPEVYQDDAPIDEGYTEPTLGDEPNFDEPPGDEPTPGGEDDVPVFDDEPSGGDSFDDDEPPVEPEPEPEPEPAPPPPVTKKPAQAQQRPATPARPAQPAKPATPAKPNPAKPAQPAQPPKSGPPRPGTGGKK